MPSYHRQMNGSLVIENVHHSEEEGILEGRLTDLSAKV